MAELTTSWSMLKEVFSGRCNSGYLYVRAYARLVSQNIEKNQSVVQYNVSTNYTNSAYANDYQAQVAISGTGLGWQYKNITQVTQGENSWITKNVTVNHNADGTANISVSAWVKFPNWGHSATATGTATLPRIPRQANLTAAPNFNDEENPTITYSNAAGNAVTSLDACITWSRTDDIKYRAIPKTGSSYTFNFTEEERNILRNACKNSNSMPVKFGVRTVMGGKTYYSTLDKTLSIVNANPVITSASAVNTIAEQNALTGSNTKIIKGYNDIKATMAATAYKGATIKEYTISNGGVTAYGSSAILGSVESGTFVFTAKDSRGNTASKTINLSMVNYIRLTNNLDVKAPNAGGDLSFRVNGNYFNSSFGAVANSLTVQYRYKTNSGAYGAWTNINVSLSGNSYSGSVSLTGLNYRNSYTFQTRAVDKLYTNGVNSPEKTVKTTPVFDWSVNDFQFNVPVKVNGALTTSEAFNSSKAITTTDTVKGGKIEANTLFVNGKQLFSPADYVVEQGSNSYGTYKKWNNGDLEMWGNVDVDISGNYGGIWNTFHCYNVKINLPAICLKPPAFNVSVRSNAYSFASPTGSSSTSMLEFWLSLSSKTNKVTVMYHATGKWK